MSATPYMPLWVGDFVTKTQALDTRQTGAYLLLLMAMWTNGGSLVEDHKQLQRIARAGREWPTVWEGIKRFFTIENGVITQSRLAEEYKKATAKVEARRQSGALGGKAKALKEKTAHVANATVLPCQSEPESELEEKGEAKASLRTRTPKSRNVVPPEDWCPTEDQVAYALSKGLSEDETYEQAERFRDWHQSERKTRNPSRNFDAAWRVWCKGALDRRRTQPRGNGGSGSRGGSGIVGAAIRSEVARRQGLAQGGGRDRDDPDNGGFGFLRVIGGSAAGSFGA